MPASPIRTGVFLPATLSYSGKPDLKTIPAVSSADQGSPVPAFGVKPRRT